jgi:rod shape-determining protein MreD
VVAATIAALALQTTLAPLSRIPFDLVLVVVLFTALSAGPVAGLLAGTFAGLAQDALSGSILGVAGLAKTVVGFLAGAFSQQFIITAGFPRLVMFVAGTLLHEFIVAGLNAVITGTAFAMVPAPVFGSAAVNAFVGLAAFRVIETGPGIVARRRAERGRIARRY